MDKKRNGYALNLYSGSEVIKALKNENPIAMFIQYEIDITNSQHANF